MSDEPEGTDLRTPEQWQADDPIRILDRDGWRDLDWNTPITREEYVRRRTWCTVTGPVGNELTGTRLISCGPVTAPPPATAGQYTVRLAAEGEVCDGQ